MSLPSSVRSLDEPVGKALIDSSRGQMLHRPRVHGAIAAGGGAQRRPRAVTDEKEVAGGRIASEGCHTGA